MLLIIDLQAVTECFIIIIQYFQTNVVYFQDICPIPRIMSEVVYFKDICSILK